MQIIYMYFIYYTCVPWYKLTESWRRLNVEKFTALQAFHYNDVIMNAMTSQITQAYIQAQIKENIKAPRHWLLWGEFTGDRWIPRTKGP